MLHLLAFAPDNHALTNECLRMVNAGDAVVLLEQGCSWAAHAEAFARLQQQAPEAHFFLLGDAVIADAVPVERIDASGLVTLTEQHAASLSWYA